MSCCQQFQSDCDVHTDVISRCVQFNVKKKNYVGVQVTGKNEAGCVTVLITAK